MEACIEELRAAAYIIPTEQPESDGTLAWDHTTLVLAHVSAAGVEGLGYSYTSTAALRMIQSLIDSVYLMDFVKATELAVGVALLANRFVPLALVVLAPVMVNILVFHVLLEPEAMGFPAVLAALHGYLAYAYRSAFALILRGRTEPTVQRMTARPSLTAAGVGA